MRYPTSTSRLISTSAREMSKLELGQCDADDHTPGACIERKTSPSYAIHPIASGTMLYCANLNNLYSFYCMKKLHDQT